MQVHTVMRQVNTPRIRRAFVENFSDTPRAQDNLSKLLTALSAIAAPSAGILQNLCTFLVRVPALGIKNTTNFVLTTFLYNDFFIDRALDRSQAQF